MQLRMGDRVKLKTKERLIQEYKLSSTKDGYEFIQIPNNIPVSQHSFIYLGNYVTIQDSRISSFTIAEEFFLHSDLMNHLPFECIDFDDMKKEQLEKFLQEK